jgi:hypothetical protein
MFSHGTAPAQADLQEDIFESLLSTFYSMTLLRENMPESPFALLGFSLSLSAPSSLHNTPSLE